MLVNVPRLVTASEIMGDSLLRSPPKHDGSLYIYKYADPMGFLINCWPA
jgi:hypothetical protein